jgi:actin-like ATPase involved in cell morphogenesis
MRDWALAIDFGTTYTSSAIVTAEGVEVLEVEGVRRLPSCVLLLDGELVVGTAAEQQATMYPANSERCPKRALGVHPHLLLGGEPVRTVDAVAAVLRAVYDEALRRSNSQPPVEVRLTHPARWTQTRLDALREAAVVAGIGEVSLLPEPVAAALHYAADNVRIGEHVAVYDLGGGTYDTAVLRRTQDGFQLVGPPGGDDRLGGEDFDHRLADLLRERLAADDPEVAAHIAESDDPTWRLAAAQLRNGARVAKEALSRQTTYRVQLPPPIDRELRITRPELEELIHDDVARTVAELQATIARAGLKDTDIAARYLTGGSSRIPLVSRMVHEAFADAPDTYDDPKVAVAIGAAKATRSRLGAVQSSAALADTGAIAVAAASHISLGEGPVQPATDPTATVFAVAEGGDDDVEAGGGWRRRLSSTRARVGVAALILLVLGGIAFALLGGGDDTAEVGAEEASDEGDGAGDGTTSTTSEDGRTTTTAPPTTVTSAPGSPPPGGNGSTPTTSGGSPPPTSPPQTSPPTSPPTTSRPNQPPRSNGNKTLSIPISSWCFPNGIYYRCGFTFGNSEFHDPDGDSWQLYDAALTSGSQYGNMFQTFAGPGCSRGCAIVDLHAGSACGAQVKIAYRVVDPSGSNRPSNTATFTYNFTC